MQKRGEKGFLKPETMKDFKEMVFSRYNRKDVHVNSGIVTACTKVTQAQTRKKSLPGGGDVGTKFHLHIRLLFKRKKVSFL